MKLSELPVSISACARLPLTVMRHTAFSKQWGDAALTVASMGTAADVGLVGFPNAGKSTLLSVISSAKPEIGDYPFTTVRPNLGMVFYRDFRSFIMADIPGIIEGAHEGKGLGHKFLKHVERCEVILHLIDGSLEFEQIQRNYILIRKELELFSEGLNKKKEIIAINKVDLIENETKLLELELKMKEFFPERDILFISAAAHINLDSLVNKLFEAIYG